MTIIFTPAIIQGFPAFSHTMVNDSASIYEIILDSSREIMSLVGFYGFYNETGLRS